MWDALTSYAPEDRDGNVLLKIASYPDAQHRHFERFQGKSVTIVEIGVRWGGSLQLWRTYFGPRARIVGVDIDPRCKRHEDDQFEIFIGDQSDREFLEAVAASTGPIDVLIDDGGHTMEQQITTFEVMYPHIAEGGVYVCEDSFSSYQPQFGGGAGRPDTFMAMIKSKIDEMHAWFAEEDERACTDFTRSALSMHFYMGLVLIEKGVVERPRVLMADGRRRGFYDLDSILEDRAGSP